MADEETKNELNRLLNKTEEQNASDGAFSFRMVFNLELEQFLLETTCQYLKEFRWSSQLALTHIARIEFNETSSILLNKVYTIKKQLFLANSLLLKSWLYQRHAYLF